MSADTVHDDFWPAAGASLEEIEAIPLDARGLPASSYAALERAAELWPDRPAVSVLRDAEHWEEPVVRTFAALAADTRRVAHALHGLGVRRGQAVALMAPNCDELLTAMLAAEAVGVAAPLNPGLSGEHAQDLVEAAGARVIVAAGPELDPETWSTARALAVGVGARALLALRPTGASDPPPDLLPLPETTVAHLGAFAAGLPDDGLPCAPPQAGDIASFLHTGGTTGTPKLAARTHRNEIVNAWTIGTQNDLAPDDSGFAALPLFHTNAVITTLITPLLTGTHVLWAGPLGYRDLPLYGVFWRLVERYRLAAMSGVPTVYAVLGQVPVDADISSLRYPVVGAAPLPPAVTRAFKERTGLDLLEGYGLTEATCASAVNRPGDIRPGTVGQRLPYQHLAAVEIDEATGAWTFLPDDTPGTVVISGPTVFAGYVVRDGAGTGFDGLGKLRDGWLDTGDLGRVDADGFLTLTGRAKDLIIRGGHNIDPAVIEDALLEHPAVTAAGAVGRPDAHAGEVPVAFVTVSPGATADPEALRAWAREHVPERAAAPRDVVVLDELPLTLVGKPFKPELRRLATEQAARDALGPAARVRAALVDGGVVVHVDGLDDDTVETVEAALSPLGVAWEAASLPPG